MQDLEYEFVKVDSLVLDILETVHVLDYHKEKELYLLVKQASMEGHYFVVDKSGKILAENKLSEGPDAFGMVLLRAGFVGNEIVFVSDGHVFVYDLSLKQVRKYPFEQDVRVKLVHFSLDNLTTFVTGDGKMHAVANLSDAYLQPYPPDYYDTLNLVHLIDVASGTVQKGGKLSPKGKFRFGEFFPFMDKPVFFSDPSSSVVSAILYGDSTLYQFDPNNGFALVNELQLKRISPDRISSVPMSEASFNTVKKFRTENVLRGGAFDGMMGNGEEVLAAYRTGADPNLIFEDANEEQIKAMHGSKKRYYFYIKDGKQMGQPIPWNLPGQLKLGVGPGRYLQYGDQAEIHEVEKDYQCYYIFGIRQKK